MLNQTRELKQQSLFGKIVKGKVISNDDPLHYGRVKIRIDSLHPQNLEDSNLPWVAAFNFSGGVNGQGSIQVPDVGSICWVIFPTNDLYSGCYLGALPNVSGELLEDYPNTYGRIDRSGNLFLINTEKDTVKFYHVSGTNISIDGSGHTKIQIANYSSSNPKADSSNSPGISIEVFGNVDLKCNEDVKFSCKNFQVDASQNMTLNAKTLNLSSMGAISIVSGAALTAYGTASAAVSSGGVVSVIGTQGNFGGTGSTFDGHAIGLYKTDVTQTPFMAFNPAGAPPTPPSASPASLPIISLQEPTPRTREAYKGE